MSDDPHPIEITKAALLASIKEPRMSALASRLDVIKMARDASAERERKDAM